jgi:hypothetical protein
MIPANCSRYFFVAALVALALAAKPARSDTITFTAPGASWQNGSNFASLEPASVTTKAPLPSGTPFWDGHSGDGATKGVGYILTGTGGFSTQYISPSSLYYLGNADGSGPAVETFKSLSGITTTYIASIAAYSTDNSVGILDETTGTTQWLTDGSTLVTINAGDTYAFILTRQSPAPSTFISDTTYSNGSLSNTDGSNQHFAIFSSNSNGTGPFYVGVEDLPYSGSDLDFNDFVFEMQATPEPASMILFGCGILGVAGYGWRKRARNKR